MEFENLQTIEEKSYVLLCQKCLEADDYFIPIYELNSLNEVVYRCSKNHEIDKTDILMLELDEDIKKRLNQCNKAEHLNMGLDGEHIFYAWCEQCKRNECELDISNDIGHDYILYEYIKPDDMIKYDLKKKLDNLKSLIDKYKRCTPKAIDLIHYLTKTYNRNFMNYNLYYNEKIVNYQSCVNVLFNINDDFKNDMFGLYEDSLNKIDYLYIYKDIFNSKQTDKIRARIFPRNFNKKEIIIPLIKDNTNKTLKNEIYFGIFMNFLEDKALFIYDINKTKISKIDLKPEPNHAIMKYSNNIIIVYDSSVFNIIYLLEDYKSYHLLQLNVNYQNQKIYSYTLEAQIMGSLFQLVIKLLKTSSYKFVFLYNGNAYSINLEKYLDNNMVLTNATENLNLLLKNSDCVLNGNSMYYNYNNLISEGVILITLSSVTYKPTIVMLDENLDIILEFEFNYPFSNGGINGVLDINYNYLNNMISLFINNEIYIFNSKTKELTTIYDISNYRNAPLNNDENIINFHQTADILSFYYYNEEKKEVDQTILLMNNYTKEIYHFYWDKKTILLKKKYDPTGNNIRIIPNISPYILESLSGEINNENNKLKNYVEGIIRLDTDKLIVIW